MTRRREVVVEEEEEGEEQLKEVEKEFLFFKTTLE